jgi:hypothetical protein
MHNLYKYAQEWLTAIHLNGGAMEAHTDMAIVRPIQT